MDSEIRKLYKRWRRYQESLDDFCPWKKDVDQMTDGEIKHVINHGLLFDASRRIKGEAAIDINLSLLGF